MERGPFFTADPHDNVETQFHTGFHDPLSGLDLIAAVERQLFLVSDDHIIEAFPSLISIGNERGAFGAVVVVSGAETGSSSAPKLARFLVSGGASCSAKRRSL